MKNFKLSLFAALFGMFFMLQSCGDTTSDSSENTADETQASSTEVTDNEEVAENSGTAKYKFKSAIVTYEMSAMGQKMSTTIYIGNYGKKIATITEMVGMKVRNLQIGNTSYVLNMASKTGEKFTDSDEDDGDNLDELDMSFYEASDEELAAQGVKKLGQEEVLGHNCTIYEIQSEGESVKTWIWDGLMLKTESKEHSLVATKLEIDADIDSEMFEVPSDFKITDASEFMENMK